MITRREFLAVGAAGLGLGAVGAFEAPVGTGVDIPGYWGDVDERLKSGDLGEVRFAHVAYEAARPLELWAVLGLLHSHGKWPVPRRISVVAASAPVPGGGAVPYVGTIEIDSQTRLSVDARATAVRASAIEGARGRLVAPIRAAGLFGGEGGGRKAETARTYYYAPTDVSGRWAGDVCEALREAARRRGAVSFGDGRGLVEAPLRVAR